MTCTEHRRLQELKRYAILDTEPEETFDRITRLTRDLFDTPIALISLADENRQWFKSKQGLHLDEATREGSFCAVALESGHPLVVEDSLLDDRFKNSDIVQGPHKIRFYAGVPLTSPSGHHLGVLCIMDHKPRKLTHDQLANLYDMGRVVIDEIELRSLATFDCLTGLQQRQGFWLKARQELERSKRYDSDLSLILFDIDRFKKVNDSYGHAAGDRVLQQIADICRSQIRAFDTPARFGGEEFTILLPQTEIADAFQIAERIRTSIANMPTYYCNQEISVTTSFGVSSLNTSNVYSVTELLRVADKCLYQAKSKGRNRTVTIAA
ncbi:diguanylate cyclase (GGDEF) domain-containing protein [Cohaesibacter marisflavi]|uniref:diguanylate cyclase n=1 Tax=Cohaesibacter marisflavi TaxID=655353 RepID=A0A1I5IBL7_9HYPH|nr:sensor domain-containing diguanylate cyclase [Cohaesibacter marisflavi]SFO57431.1 diguanylate cyclase (GGDEF) domain-containing protein [Cohaesibacter marisflavi]